MTQTRGHIDYPSLVDVVKGVVHSDVYTDPEIFEEEMEKIFHQGWVYVGHDSEIPEPGDYALKPIGRQSIIMCRDDQGQIRLLMNRCMHRANAVCQYDEGNTSFFRCAYHGWTYKNTGELVGMPFSDNAYTADFRKEEHGLTPVPRMEIYRGFEIREIDEHARYGFRIRRLGRVRDIHRAGYASLYEAREDIDRRVEDLIGRVQAICNVEPSCN